MKSGKIRRSSRRAKTVLIRCTGRVVRFGKNCPALFPIYNPVRGGRFSICGAVRGNRHCAFSMMLFNAGVLYLLGCCLVLPRLPAREIAMGLGRAVMRANRCRVRSACSEVCRFCGVWRGCGALLGGSRGTAMYRAGVRNAGIGRN